MNCCEFVELLVDFSEGQLSEDSLAKFESHRDACQHCAGYASKYLETIRLGRAACHRVSDETPSQQVPEQLVRRILDAHDSGEFLA